jgi:membrane-associated HD superfamily phosphohydrolase
MSFLVGVFLVLHGLVHLFYVGQGLRLFELEESMSWPDGSWLFSRILGTDSVRVVAAALCAIATAGFVLAGIGVTAKQGWWDPLAVASAVFSSAVFILLWNGKTARIVEQGLVAVLINVGVLAGLMVADWPDFDF